MDKNKITKEQQCALNEFARCVHEGTLIDEAKKEAVQVDAFKLTVVTNKSDLDKGVPVSFTSGDKTIKGTLRAKYSRNWEFIEG